MHNLLFYFVIRILFYSHLSPLLFLPIFTIINSIFSFFSYPFLSFSPFNLLYYGISSFPSLLVLLCFLLPRFLFSPSPVSFSCFLPFSQPSQSLLPFLFLALDIPSFLHFSSHLLSLLLFSFSPPLFVSSSSIIFPFFFSVTFLPPPP